MRFESSGEGVALVTGGVAGIGRAICRELARNGYDIGVLDVVSEPADLSREIAELGVRVAYAKADVSSPDEVVRGYDALCQTLGPPIALVNNAGIYPRHAAIDMPYELWRRVLDVNLGGAFLCSQAAAPAMLADGVGAIVNIASGRALQGAVKGSHYAASKSGLIGLTRSLAAEWAPTIRVNAVIPGLTDTAQPRQDGASGEEIRARGTRIPLKRIGQPADIARVVKFLLSGDAAYITGQSICVNGGSIML